MRAQSVKRADLVNRSVNNIRLTLNNERSDNSVQSTTAEPEATISIDYMKHNFIRLIYYSSIENTILEPYFHNI